MIVVKPIEDASRQPKAMPKRPPPRKREPCEFCRQMRERLARMLATMRGRR